MIVAIAQMTGGGTAYNYCTMSFAPLNSSAVPAFSRLTAFHNNGSNEIGSGGIVFVNSSFIVPAGVELFMKFDSAVNGNTNDLYLEVNQTRFGL
jgi:hypothetical protein